jgi:hypothetical protein
MTAGGGQELQPQDCKHGVSVSLQRVPSIPVPSNRNTSTYSLNKYALIKPLKSQFRGIASFCARNKQPAPHAGLEVQGELPTDTATVWSAWSCPIRFRYIFTLETMPLYNLSIQQNPWQLSRYSDGLRVGRPGFDSRQGQGIFLLSTASRLALGPTRPHRKWVPGLFHGVKRQRREADHSPPPSTEVKNIEAISPLPHMSSWRGT